MLKDTIIIGGGISGLNLGLNISKNNKNFLIFDKRDYIGGRLKTIYGNKYHYETGGARFNDNHINLKKLLKKYNLNKIKIPSSWKNINVNFKNKSEYNDVNKLIKDLIILGKGKTKKFLMKHTLYSLCEELIDKNSANFLAINHPYYSEIFITNAFDALNSVKLDLREDKQFYIVKEGLSYLINLMINDIGKNKIKKNRKLINIKFNNNIYICYIKNLQNNKIEEYQCNNIILAMDSCGLKKINYLNPIKTLLNSVECLPLFRIYQKYSKIWFKDIGKIVTDKKIRYIIPVNYDEGIIMISYTDGKYSNYWKKKMDSNELEKNIKQELEILFPNIKIPKPLWTKSYYWKLGACYWKPNVDSKIISNKIMKPLKNENLYICGSNYSNRQAWIEGALESSNNIYNLLIK